MPAEHLATLDAWQQQFDADMKAGLEPPDLPPGFFLLNEPEIPPAKADGSVVVSLNIAHESQLG